MEPYPGNFHYWKNIKIIGGADTNADKHISEYQKRFMDRYSDSVKKNQPFYLQALAARQHKKYMQIVHGQKDSRNGQRQLRNHTINVVQQVNKNQKGFL